MRTVCLVMHALCNVLDPAEGLTEEGLLQVRLVASQLGPGSMHLAASPQPRAQKTAEMIREELQRQYPGQVLVAGIHTWPSLDIYKDGIACEEILDSLDGLGDEYRAVLVTHREVIQKVGPLLVRKEVADAFARPMPGDLFILGPGEGGLVHISPYREGGRQSTRH